MDHTLQRKLSSLPPLGSSAPGVRKCKVCGASAPMFDVVDFNKACLANPYEFGVSGIQIEYFRCVKCLFLFTDLIDDWDVRDTAAYIYNDDYIKVDPAYLSRRPEDQAEYLAELLNESRNLRILDYGSGSGQFAEHMRERGFSYITSYDPFSNPTPPQGLFDLVTAFEVVEHSPRPLNTFREMRNFTKPSGGILVSQTLQPPNIDELRCSWWYVAPRNGHVSTYSSRTFAEIARQMGLLYRPTQGHSGVYAFTRASLSPAMTRALERIGPTVTLHVLTAPGSGRGPSSQWHELEDFGGTTSFRWSAEWRVGWDDCILESGLNRIELPFLMEARAGFAKECKLSVAGFEVAASVSGQALVAEIEVETRGSCRVEMLTPPPIAPSDIGPSLDGRELGLAVPVGEGDGAF